jgi:hypothetical protein
MSIRHCLAIRINRLAGLVSGELRIRSECAIILALMMLLLSCAKPRPIKYYQISYPASVPAAPAILRSWSGPSRLPISTWMTV